ncbi:MAG: hypothetical protein KatS3mg054_1105 [Chloroflexus sp.]|nr:MAG: hypothetical protein KatS3mg054_1105 [Chloroflexus sp.]
MDAGLADTRGCSVSIGDPFIPILCVLCASVVDNSIPATSRINSVTRAWHEAWLVR